MPDAVVQIIMKLVIQLFRIMYITVNTNFLVKFSVCNIVIWFQMGLLMLVVISVLKYFLAKVFPSKHQRAFS